MPRGTGLRRHAPPAVRRREPLTCCTPERGRCPMVARMCPAFAFRLICLVGRGAESFWLRRSVADYLGGPQGLCQKCQDSRGEGLSAVTPTKNSSITNSVRIISFIHPSLHKHHGCTDTRRLGYRCPRTDCSRAGSHISSNRMGSLFSRYAGQVRSWESGPRVSVPGRAGECKAAYLSHGTANQVYETWEGRYYRLCRRSGVCCSAARQTVASSDRRLRLSHCGYQRRGGERPAQSQALSVVYHRLRCSGRSPTLRVPARDTSQVRSLSHPPGRHIPPRPVATSCQLPAGIPEAINA